MDSCSANTVQLVSQYNLVRPLYRPNFVGILGGPLSGRKTLLHAVKESGECVGGRVVCASFPGHIRKWHLEPANRSPLRDLCLSHQVHIDSGIPIPDEEISQIIMYFLYAIERKIMHERSMVVFSEKNHTPGIGTFICSGWPGNFQQLDFVKKHFESTRLVLIDADKDRAEITYQKNLKRNGLQSQGNIARQVFDERWKTFNSVTHPMFLDFEKECPQMVKRINPERSLTEKAITLIRTSISCSSTRGSLISKLEPKCNTTKDWATDNTVNKKPTRTAAMEFIARVENGELVPA